MIVLTLLCIAIFLASFGLGSIPLYMHLSEVAVSRMSSIGIGVLIASALAIIIPEGLEAVTSVHQVTSVSGDDLQHEISRYSGLAIVGGFALMFLIDQLSPHVHSASQSEPAYVVVDDLHGLRRDSDLNSMENSSPDSSDHDSTSTTIGLCIHSLADGVALGASASASATLSSVVFLAILLHKGPAAFALVAVNLKNNLARRMLQLHLLAFSLAAPIGALLTSTLFSWSNMVSSDQVMSSRTGLLLLFSGGTFLHVAVSHFPRKHVKSSELLPILAGLLLPVLISLSVGHPH